MHYYLYEIRNNLNGKIYVGVHKTVNLDDGYMGSGKIIRSAIQKHGISNFSKVILETFDTSEAMYAREAVIVTDEFLARDDVYNLRRGGNGGFDYINASGMSVPIYEQHLRDSSLTRRTVSAAIEGNHRWSQDNPELISNRASSGARARNAKYGSSFVSLNTDPLFQEKRRAKFNEIGHAKGKKNSQYGTCWIWHELIGNKKINKSLLPEYIDQGWVKGRYLAFG